MTPGNDDAVSAGHYGLKATKSYIITKHNYVRDVHIIHVISHRICAVLSEMDVIGVIAVKTFPSKRKIASKGLEFYRVRSKCVSGSGLDFQT